MKNTTNFIPYLIFLLAFGVSCNDNDIRPEVKHSTQFYLDLAWGGLTHYKDATGNYVETPLFLQLVPSATDRARISNTISIELTGKDTSGTTKPQKGLKAGCWHTPIEI